MGLGLKIMEVTTKTTRIDELMQDTSLMDNALGLEWSCGPVNAWSLVNTQMIISMGCVCLNSPMAMWNVATTRTANSTAWATSGIRMVTHTQAN